MSKIRVLLVGVGRRAQKTLLPALHCMRPWIELVAVHARTSRDVSLLDGRISLTTRDDLGTIDASALDAIIVAVRQRQVPAALKALEGIDTSRITLMLDTPVLHHKDLGGTRHFSEYKEVLASEDSFALPPYVLARNLVEDGLIGQLRHIYLFHSGMRFHALASLQQLTGAMHTTSIRIQKWNPWCARLTFRFPGGARATVIEPRRYESGRIMIVGDGGFLVDYPMDHPNAKQIGYRTSNGLYVGLTVDGEQVPQSDLDLAFVEGLSGADLVDPSLMNMLKIRGCMEMLAALGDPAAEFRYPAFRSIHDNISIRVADRLRFLKDVRLGERTTLFGQALRLRARVARIKG
jgi:predicted dehydrogenase